MKDEDRTKYSGSVYKPYKEVCYYDEQNSFICYGDYYSEYCLIEIATDTYIGIRDEHIVVVIFKILGIKENDENSVDKRLKELNPKLKETLTELFLKTIDGVEK